VARIHETGDPWGMLFTTGNRSSRMPSRHTATCLSSRKDAVHLTIVKGMPFFRMMCRSLGWFTKSK
ncbi:hypothetical protein K439DRAFT_1267470, partial [Ramaria rubella]